MIEFTSKEDYDNFINELKDTGLRTYISDSIENDFTSEVFKTAFDVLTIRLSEEDYEAFVLEVCDNFTYREER